MYTAFGCDMGKNTMAITVLSCKKTTHKIVDTFYFRQAIKSLTPKSLPCAYAEFRREFVRLVNKYKPDIVYAERFMVRGRFNGASAEIISYMMGIMHSICAAKKILFVPITAAQWKNKINKSLCWPVGVVHKSNPLKEWYTAIKPTQPHFLDSYLIGLYGADQHYKTQHFSKFSKRHITALMKKERLYAKHGANRGKQVSCRKH